MAELMGLQDQADAVIAELEATRDRAPELERLKQTLPRANGEADSW